MLVLQSLLHLVPAQVSTQGTAPTATTKLRSTWLFLRGVVLGALLWGCIYGINRIHQASLPQASEISACEHQYDPISNYTHAEAPEIPSTIKDDYLGSRPNVDSIANISLMVEACHEIVDGQGVDDVVNCLAYLAEKENEYLTLPVANSSQTGQPDSRSLDVANGNQSDDGPAPSPNHTSVDAASASSIGTCPGEVIPFHVYWTGPATWRFELLSKHTYIPKIYHAQDYGYGWTKTSAQEPSMKCFVTTQFFNASYHSSSVEISH